MLTAAQYYPMCRTTMNGRHAKSRDGRGALTTAPASSIPPVLGRRHPVGLAGLGRSDHPHRSYVYADRRSRRQLLALVVRRGSMNDAANDVRRKLRIPMPDVLLFIFNIGPLVCLHDMCLSAAWEAVAYMLVTQWLQTTIRLRFDDRLLIKSR